MTRAEVVAVALLAAVLAVVPSPRAALAGDGPTAPTSGASAPDEAAVYAIAPAGSTLTFKAYKEGWLSGLGHDHTIAARAFAGAVRLDRARPEAASVTLTVTTAALEVLDPSASEGDRKKIDATLRSADVLDVARHAEIRFASTAVRVVERQPRGRLKLEVTGDLTLRDRTAAVTFATFVEPPGEGGDLVASGVIAVDQSRFGIEPYGAGLGAVKVKDRVELEFKVDAKRASGH